MTRGFDSLLCSSLGSHCDCSQTTSLFSVCECFVSFLRNIPDPILDKIVPERALEVPCSLSVLVLRLLSEAVLSFLKCDVNTLLERRVLNTSSTPGPLLKTSLCKSTTMVLRRSWFRFAYRIGFTALEL